MTATAELTYREGRPGDLRATFALSRLAVHHTARRFGGVRADPPSEQEIEREWARNGDLVEFIAAQGGEFWICEEPGRPVGYARVCEFDGMQELTELMVLPSHHGQGIGRALLDRCWPGDPSPGVGRLIVAAGAPVDLTLYLGFGVMPATGHWHMKAGADDYSERRSHERDVSEPPVVVLSDDHAVAEWNRLEPPAIGHQRPRLHEFFGRTRTCLATMEAGGERASAVCWVGPAGQIGPAVGATARELLPVVLQALDRVARATEPDHLSVFSTTDSRALLRRLRALGFRAWWPSWVMSSQPLPGLDRYLPSRPPLVL